MVYLLRNRLEGNQVHECLVKNLGSQTNMKQFELIEMSDVAPLVNTATTKKKHYIVEGHCKMMVPSLSVMSSFESVVP